MLKQVNSTQVAKRLRLESNRENGEIAGLFRAMAPNRVKAAYVVKKLHICMRNNTFCMEKSMVKEGKFLHLLVFPGARAE